MLATPQSVDVSALAQALAGLVSQAQATKAVSSTPRSAGYAHGRFGLLSAPGMSRELINAMMLPHLGIQSLLPSRPSNEQNPLYGIITGVTAESGTFSGANSAGVCEDPPMAGLLKICTQSYVFGRQSMQTEVFELDRLGLTTNRGEFHDFELIGDPFGNVDNNLVPSVPGGSMRAGLNNEVNKAMFELAVGWLRQYSRWIYTGNPSNNTGGGILKEYRGLNGLINTGYRDAESGTACARADSIVRTFGSANIKTAPTATNGIVTVLTGIYRALKYRAVEMGLAPVKWVIAMRWSAFYELTELWPCAYSTYVCSTTNTSYSFNLDGGQLDAMRTAMRGDWDNRTGQYLLINGERVPVVIDDAINETALANGAFNSDIYFIPLTVLGGRPVTYMEHVNYDAQNGFMDGARQLAPDGSFSTSDGGRFAWHRKPPTNFCVQALVKTEPRLILRTPMLAARLTNVAYTPWQHEDEAYTTPGYYFFNGGKTGQGTAPSFFSPNANVG